MNQDELYSYDRLHRLTDMDRGDLADSDSDGDYDTINSTQFAQGWGLDSLGNWSSFDEDSDGDGTNDLAQSREHNQVNEIADTSGDGDAITESAGSSWVDPAHDAAGNPPIASDAIGTAAGQSDQQLHGRV